MEKNNYNDDLEFSKLINDLKELPKEKAPDNFEYNLLTRIKNKNFGELKPERKEHFNFVKFFAPSAVVASAIIIFFLVLPESNHQIENPLMSEPPAITERTVNTSDATADSQLPNTANRSENINKSKSSVAQNMVIKPNDVVEEQKVRYPINRSRSVSLDDYISGSNKKGTNLRQGSVVGGAEETPDFDGFLMRQEADPETIQRYKQMMDSVKKAQEKADSVQKATK